MIVIKIVKKIPQKQAVIDQESFCKQLSIVFREQLEQTEALFAKSCLFSQYRSLRQITSSNSNCHSRFNILKIKNKVTGFFF